MFLCEAHPHVNRVPLKDVDPQVMPRPSTSPIASERPEVPMFPLIVHAALAAPLEPVPMSDETYAETYTAVASLEDSSFVLLQLLFTNAGFGSGRGGCRALWVPPGQSGINTSQNGDRGDWSYDAAASTLTVGDCSLGPATEGLRFSAALPELSVELTLAGVSARSVSVPDGRISVKNST